MPAIASPQLRFLLRGSACFVVLLAVWWFGLLHPMLDGLQLSTDLTLRLLAGWKDTGSVTVSSNGDWIVRLPIPESVARQDAVQKAFGRAPGAPPVKVRSIRLAIAERIPTFFTLSFPLFWAVMLAGPLAWGLWRPIAMGTALLWGLAVVSVIFYAAFSAENNMALAGPGLASILWNGAEYLNVNVVPYMTPLLLGLGLNRGLRGQVFLWDPLPVELPAPSAEAAKSSRGRYRRK